MSNTEAENKENNAIELIDRKLGMPVPDYLFKILLLGDSGTPIVFIFISFIFEIEIKKKITLSGVGKTSLMLRYADGIFDKYNMASTAGIDLKIKYVKKNKKIIKLQIWDTAGQERYRTIARTYYKNINGIMLVCDLTDTLSIENLETWIAQIKKEVESMPIVLLANKCEVENKDLEENRMIAESFAKKHSIEFIEVSAQGNHAVLNAFNCIINAIEAVGCYKIVASSEKRIILGKEQSGFTSNSSSCTC